MEERPPGLGSPETIDLGPTTEADAKAGPARPDAGSEETTAFVPTAARRDGVPVDPAHLGIPQRLGRYTVQRAAGRGGSAVVYEGYDPHLRRTVSIKVPHQRVCPEEAGTTQLLPEGTPPVDALDLTTGDDLVRDVLIEEARSAVAMESFPGVVRVFDVGRECGWSFIVGQWMPGGSLQDRLREGPLEIEEACSIVADIAETLHRCHEAGWLHRDIKPANILLDEHGRPHLADFGLTVHRELLIRTDVVPGGTPTYMAPELAGIVLTRVRGERGSEENPHDRRGDIFALGVTLYILLVGQSWHDKTTPREILELTATTPVPSPREKRPKIPASIDRIVLKATAVDPDERYPDAETMAIKLRAAIAAMEVRRLMTDSAPSPSRRSNRSARWRRFASGTALAVAGAGLLLAMVYLVRGLQTETATPASDRGRAFESAVADAPSAPNMLGD